ncbi:MAG: mobile mystery protein B [Ignavibacteriae bacterium]|nr:mobile mystery protein B [Ignavibacteriota bacterium]
MGLNLEYIAGQTPIDEDEKYGLLIPTLTLRSELDEFEQQNIENAIQWTMSRSFTVSEILTEDFVRRLHLRMFSDVWKWAGDFRRTNKNIGVDKFQIGIELRNLLDDCRFWIEHETYPADEIAVRFSHRLVLIHCFPNGNGRHSRLIADVLIEKALERPIFTWGSVTLTQQGVARKEYLQALRSADKGDVAPLIAFARG